MALVLIPTLPSYVLSLLSLDVSSINFLLLLLFPVLAIFVLCEGVPDFQLSSEHEKVCLSVPFFMFL